MDPTRGQLWSLKVIGIDRAHTTLTETMRSFSRYGELFVECRRFYPTHLHLAPSLGVTPLEFHRDVKSRQKTRVPGLSCGVVCLRDPMFTGFDTIPACDRQMEGRTSRRTDRQRAIA